MRTFIELWQWVIAHYRDPDHDQRKQFATACNTVAAIVMVNYCLNGKGVLSVLMLPVAVSLWMVSIAVVRKDKEE